uniref:alpha-L-rhamnosidase C-terminal domain-containing protein n=1 Tax=Gemmiger formicilis TaxID=745368 RepID=UPI003FED4B96
MEPTEAGYRKFKFAPVVGGGITEAEGTVGTPYGVIKAAWKIADGEMTMTVAVPVGTECTVVPPSGEEKALGSGEYTVTAKA